MSDELNLADWTSGNKKVDDFIREKQSKIYALHGKNAVFEWIPYDQFKNIIEKSKNGFATIHSAIWKDGPLIFVSRPGGLKRVPHQKVNLKCLYISKYATNDFLNQV